MNGTTTETVRRRKRKASDPVPEDIVQLILDDLILNEAPKLIALKYNVSISVISRYKRERLEYVLRRKPIQLEMFKVRRNVKGWKDRI